MAKVVRSELISKVAEKLGVEYYTVNDTIVAFIEEITLSLAGLNTVSLTGLGKFRPVIMEPRPLKGSLINADKGGMSNPKVRVKYSPSPTLSGILFDAVLDDKEEEPSLDVDQIAEHMQDKAE